MHMRYYFGTFQHSKIFMVISYYLGEVMSYLQSYCSNMINQPRHTNTSSYSYPDSPDIPPLPNLDQRKWYCDRDWLPPPEIGFKWDILNFPNEEHGRLPYPEADKFAMQPDNPLFPSGRMNSLSDSSTTPLTDYSDCDKFGSDVEDGGNPSISTEAKCLNMPSKPCTVDEDSHFLPTFDRSEKQTRRRGIRYPTRAFEEVKERPCDHSGGDYREYNA
ncbi:hypothetical protein ECG_02861 [Echinococcus granulosus]|nr:hypothetical protein ECG_02861 [Echinococcus granulosus]